MLRGVAGLVPAVAAGRVATAAGAGDEPGRPSGPGRGKGSHPRAAVAGGPGADGYRLGWTATASNASYELLHGVAATPDGGAIAAGTTRNGEPMNPWVVGVTPDGAVDYDTVVEMDGFGKLFDVHPREDGGAWAAGWAEPGDDPPQALLVAVDAGGEVLDTWSFGGDASDAAHAVVPLGDGLALLGRTISYGTPGTSAYVQHVGTEGSTGTHRAWSPEGGSATVEDAVPAPDGEAVVVGRWDPAGAETHGAALSWLAPDGSPRWTTPLDHEGDLRTPSVARLDDGTLVVGVDERTDEGSTPRVVGFDADGDRQWTLSDLGGSAAVVGVARAGDSDCWVVGADGAGPARLSKVSPSGDRRWTRQFDGSTAGISEAAAPTDLGVLTAGRVVDGETDGFVDHVEVVNDPPEPSVSIRPRSPPAGQPVTFDASGSTDPDGEIVRYEWDLDDDGTVDATGPEATHEYDTAGDRRVTLRVVDDVGASRTVTVDVSVGTEPPTGGDGVAVPGFGAGAALAGLGGAVLALVRRRR